MARKEQGRGFAEAGGGGKRKRKRTARRGEPRDELRAGSLKCVRRACIQSQRGLMAAKLLRLFEEERLIR
jgi:hypothetical protein